MRSKVFGIGLNKTGTSTLGICLTQLGYRHTSYRSDLFHEYFRGKITTILKAADAVDSAEDWPWPLVFKELYWRFAPNAKFILTTRASPTVWVESLKQHSLNTHPVTPMRQSVYGYKYPHGYEAEHIRFYEAHNDHVRAFFSREAPEALLEVCWERGDGWDRLCAFLGTEVPSGVFPHVRPRSTGVDPHIRRQNELNIARQLAEIQQVRR